MDHHQVASSLLQLAELKSKFWNTDEALPLAHRALAIELKQHGAQHGDVANCIDVLAAIHILSGEVADSITSLGRCLKIREEVLGPAALATAYTLEAWALLGLHIGQDEFDHLKIAFTPRTP